MTIKEGIQQQCIFCLEDKESSLEHVFPDAIGGSLILSNLCKECNSWLGREVDCKLTENFLVQMARYKYKIPNRQGDIIDPFPNLRIEKTNEPVRQLIDKKTGDIQGLYILPQKPWLQEEGNKKVIRLTLDVQDKNRAPEIIKKFCNRNGISVPTDEQFNKMLEESKEICSRPTLTGKFCVDVRGIKRALLKIVYELSYYWLGKNFLDDNMANKMRGIVVGIDYNTDVKGDFGFGINRFGKILHYKEGTHFAFLYPSDSNNLCMVVRIFDCMEAIVVITENGSRYKINKYNAPYILLDAIKKEKREGRFLDYFFKPNCG